MGGQFLSKGEAVDRRAMTADYYPQDQAETNTIQNRAEILFLIESGESLKIVSAQGCVTEIPTFLHFHLVLS